MIDNNKLAKELSSIYSSSNKAKKSVVAELAKIDEKYKKLAEQEKAQLNKTLEMLDNQLKYYGTLLGLSDDAVEEKVEEAVVEEPEKVEEEPVIEDTVFEENNEKAKVDDDADELPFKEDVVEETVAEESPVEEKKDEYSDIWPDDSENSGKSEEKESEEKAGDEDEWPAFPEDWK